MTSRTWRARLVVVLVMMLPCCATASRASSAEETARFRQIAPGMIGDIERIRRALEASAKSAGAHELSGSQREQLRSLREGALRCGAKQLRCKPEALLEVYAFLLAAGVESRDR